MRRLTLLEVVQEVLNDMDGDEVNSIDDTIESMQVAYIARSIYESIISGRDWPHLYQLFQLDASTDIDFPTYFTIPTDINEVEWIKYDKKKLITDSSKYQEVKYKTPKEFIEHCNTRVSTNSNVQAIADPSGVTIYVLSDNAPMYYTSFDNDTIIMDAYDSALENTLQSSKVQCYGKRLPSFALEDSFIPDLPTQAFAYYLNEVKSVASNKLRQMPDQKAEQHSITGRRRMSQEAWKVSNGITYPNYGRTPKK